MGFARKSFLSLGIVILLITLVTMNLFLVLSLSLRYENVKPELKKIMIEYVNAGDNNFSKRIDKSYLNLQLECTNQTEIQTGELIQGFGLTIPCSVVSQGKDALVDYGFANLIDDIYYKDYSCKMLIDCYTKTIKNNEQAFVMISKTAQDYWQEKFYVFLLIALAFLILLFLLVEKKRNFFVLIGILITLASLPFFKINFVLSWVMSHFNLNADITIQDPTNMLFLYKISQLLFNQSGLVFALMFFIGVLLLIMGIFWEFTSLIWGVFHKHISNLSGKLVKKEDNEEE